MSSRKLRRLSEFEWASVARYILYIEGAAGLVEINSNHVNCLGLRRLGLDKLLKQKDRTLKLLLGNKEKLEAFVGRYSPELGDDERAVLRTIYIQYQRSVSTVRDHIALLLDCKVQIEMALIDLEGGQKDEALF